MRLSLILALAMSAQAGMRHAPTQAVLDSVLDAARLAWGVSATEVTITLSAIDSYGNPFGPCITGQPNVMATSEYGVSRVISMNAHCDWSRYPLREIVTHELGHMLQRSDKHSDEIGSVMNLVILPGQRITAKDRALLAGNGGPVFH